MPRENGQRTIATDQWKMSSNNKEKENGQHQNTKGVDGDPGFSVLLAHSLGVRMRRERAKGMQIEN